MESKSAFIDMLAGKLLPAVGSPSASWGGRCYSSLASTSRAQQRGGGGVGGGKQLPRMLMGVALRDMKPVLERLIKEYVQLQHHLRFRDII